MKKFLALTFALMAFSTAIFAVNYPFSISETFTNADGCTITMTGSGTVSIDPPKEGQSGPLHAEAHGSVSFSFSAGCGQFSGMVVSVTFNYQDPNDGSGSTLSGSDKASQDFLLANPDAASHLKAAIQAKVHYQ